MRVTPKSGGTPDFTRETRVLPPLIPVRLDERHPPLVFRLANFARNRVAGFFKAGKIPEVRKFFALLRLDGLDGAAFACQKNARAIWLLLERQSAAIPTQAGELLDKIFFAQLLERREPRDFLVG